MLRRSKRITSLTSSPSGTPNNKEHEYKTIPAQGKLRPEHADRSEPDQSLAVRKDFRAQHSYEARAEQAVATVDLLNGRTTILLAGTGFGKSRVPEMFFHAHESKYAPIILSINPLESLGHDQVSEKAAVGISAVNLTGANCTPQTCEDILQGKYTFVYVSPEIALTSDVFDQMWKNSSYQARLVLIVIDEAHMVYEWGLVASGEAKRLASHARVQDAGVFRPSYGDLARLILSAGKMPLLLMSATCTPQALLAIQANLKLDTRNVRIIQAELTRPEIRLIRRSFKRPVKAALRGLWAHHTVIPTDAIPPTLIYCGTQNATLDFLIMICLARGIPLEAANGHSTFARRYHATTGPKAKLDAVETYVAGALAVLCCTLALGLGQNWHRVRRVVVVGRQAPSNFIQMSGRCGRDGRRGLGFLLVECNRTRGKNSVLDFCTPTIMSDDDRMDALAITPVCLRVALAVDLSFGYIPLQPGCQDVKDETKRQQQEKMSECDCSSCRPEEAEALWLAQSALTHENFDQALKMDQYELAELISALPEPPPPPPVEPRSFALVCSKDDEIMRSIILEKLVTLLHRAFTAYFFAFDPRPSALGPNDYFGRDLAWDVAKNIDILSQPSDLEVVLVSEMIPGQFDCLFGAFLRWQDDYDTRAEFADAATRRLAATRPKPHAVIPQSVEGALMAKERNLAEKQATKEIREVKKEQAATAKAAEKAEAARQKEAIDAEKQANKVARDLARALAAKSKAAKKEQAARAKATADAGQQAKKVARELARGLKSYACGKGEAARDNLAPDHLKKEEGSHDTEGSVNQATKLGVKRSVEESTVTISPKRVQFCQSDS